MGKGSVAAATFDGEDAIKVGVRHGRPGGEAEATVERIFGYC